MQREIISPPKIIFLRVSKFFKHNEYTFFECDCVCVNSILRTPGPNAFSPPLNFLPYTRLKFTPVSNIARICGEEPPSIHMQFRGGLLIGHPALTDTLDSLAHRRSVSALSLFYRYYHGFCSDEIKSIIPPNASFVRNTRFSKIQRPYALKLDTNRTNTFANSFIPMASRDWNSLPPTVFPTTYNLQSFKSSIHRYLQLLPNP